MKCLIFILISIIVVVKSSNDKALLGHLHYPRAPQINIKPLRTTQNRIAEHGYPAETHNVRTEDGYLLTMFRIPFSHKLQNQNQRRPVVLLQHGLFSCSDVWVFNGPNDALPFLLADAGYDVWFGNARGNVYSRNHTITSIKHPDFWHFSWHEIGYYDLPAMINYALNINGHGEEAIHYFGHSQGTTAVLVLLSTRPEYNKKFKIVHLLAPVAFMSNMQYSLVKLFSPFLGHTNTYSALFCGQEFLPYNRFFILLGYNACGSESIEFKGCSFVASLFQGTSHNRNETALTYLAETHPAGASTNQICHYMQEHQSGRFCYYDYGAKKNLKKYGHKMPPNYPLEHITAEMHLWYSDNDKLAAVVDVEELADLLQNRVLHHMEDPLWSHGDFAVAKQVRKSINEPAIDIMRKYEESHQVSKKELNKIDH